MDSSRVDTLDESRLLRLRAEMKLPGDAWLEFTITPHPRGSVLEQRALFHLRGLWGRVYWLSIAPFDALIFRTMARRIVREAEAGRARP